MNAETNFSADQTSPARRSAPVLILGLIIMLLLTFAAPAIGARSPPGDWYASLNKPTFNPPNWIFGTVWTMLYVMMAVAAWLVWRDRGISEARFALSSYLVQLALNALWSVLFFGYQLIGISLLDIVALWIAILITLIAFWRINRFAAGLLIPYLAWVSFASLLNFAIWRLN